MKPFQGNIITPSEKAKRAHASMTPEARLAASEAGKAHGHLGGAYGHLGGRKWHVQADDGKLEGVGFTGNLWHTDVPTELTEKQARDSGTWHQSAPETQR